MYIALLVLMGVVFILLLAGVVKPKVFRRVLGRRATRKNVYSLFGGMFALLFFGSSVTLPEDWGSHVEGGQTKLYQTGPFEVVKIVDGDTFDVQIGGKVKRVRLIGINTPETVDPRKPVGCFGLEASERAKELLEGEQVTLFRDESAGDADRYGRLLRYAALSDGTSFNKRMIEEGFAYEYTYEKNNPYAYREEFKQAEDEARDSKRGLWADDACGYTTQ